VITIAIANQKGGVGKTTTAVTLAHGFALHHQPTLLIDLDIQGNVADVLGMESQDSLTKFIGPEFETSFWDCMSKGRNLLDVIQANKKTAEMKFALGSIESRGGILAKVLSNVDKNYYLKYVILDCSPSVDILHTAALMAADWLIIPTILDQLAIKGMVEMLNSLAAVRTYAKADCQLAGIIPTFCAEGRDGAEGEPGGENAVGDAQGEGIGGL
jgi:chromosome partitioning protein